MFGEGRVIKKVKVQASCGFYAGEPKWRSFANDWCFVLDECCWEGTVEIDEENWSDEAGSMTCPQCGSLLTQDMDHFELL
ncbi:hypothetical protein [Bacillus licheniformis]|uniref:hypothetical protein n=1 Tax=Bacillus licheniformis TaxID=1402 RepID=UPI001D934450|nr:hypothetical protein [Bacillus licheniformis]